MKRRLLEVEITYRYILAVDDESHIVQAYDNQDEMLEHLADYRFSATLPVIEDGAVLVEDITVQDIVIT